MAHGGHGGGHAHVHHHYRSGGDSGSGWTLLLWGGLLVGLLIIMALVGEYRLAGKQPLEANYPVYPVYLIDENDFFSEPDELTEGLKYIHEKTNVQVVMMSSSEWLTDKKAVDMYYEMFDDEAHVLIICPTAWYTSSVYYAIGDLADTVIDDYAMNYLLDNTGKTSNGSKWKKYLINLADSLLEQRD